MQQDEKFFERKGKLWENEMPNSNICIAALQLKKTEKRLHTIDTIDFIPSI